MEKKNTIINRVLLFVLTSDTNLTVKALNILSRDYQNINLIGVSAAQGIDVDIQDNNLSFIDPNEISKIDYDIILTIGGKNIGAVKIINYLKGFNIDVEKLLHDWIVCIPGFTVKKYEKLKKTQLTIFSMHCFGGFISHLLGLKFRSPFVNLFMHEDEYIRFLRCPRIYMEEELIFNGTKMEPNLKIDYPIYLCGNVNLHMNHYSDFDYAKRIWNERKQRINWYNIIPIMFTDDHKVLEEFDKLPYGKKVCFVSFKSDLDSAFYINPEIRKDLVLYEVVNYFGMGSIFFYDIFDLLLYGKKTPLIEM